MKAYYQLSGEEVLREVNGSEEPLTKEQISENQRKYGPNELTEGKKKTTFQIFLEQYKDFLVIILIIARSHQDLWEILRAQLLLLS